HRRPGERGRRPALAGCPGDTQPHRVGRGCLRSHPHPALGIGRSALGVMPSLSLAGRNARRACWRALGRRRTVETVSTEIAPGVWEIDTLLSGWQRITAGYLIAGPAPVLIETGSQTSVPALLAALDDLGMSPGQLAGIAVTH